MTDLLRLDLPDRYDASEVLFANLSRGRSGKPAVRCGAEVVTYGELAERASRAGSALRRLGLPPLSRVLLLLLDTPAFPAAFFGAVRAGYVPILANTNLPPADVEYFLRDSGAVAAIADAELFSKIAEGRPRCPDLAHAVVVGGERRPDAVSWDELLAGGDPELAPSGASPEDPSFWMYSSGSTGKPKGTIHRHRDVAYTIASYAERVLGVREDDVAYSVAKLYFAYGFGNGMTFPFAAGATAVLSPARPTPEAIFETIERERPTIFFGVPTAYVGMLAHPGAEGRDLSSLRLCVSAGESLPGEVYRRWMASYGVPILDGCGSTEMLHIYLSNRPDRTKPGSTGVPVPGYEVRLVDEHGEPVPPGEPGDLLVRGGSAAPCYWNRPEATAHTMRGEWLFTGDRFHQDEDGFFFYDGRSDDMLKVAGQWVSPIEVEKTLIEHPAVLESGVIGVVDADGLVKTKAFVVLRAGVDGSRALARDLQEFVKSRIAPHKYPRAVAFVPELPKTATGKIQRFRLRELEDRAAAESRSA